MSAGSPGFSVGTHDDFRHRGRKHRGETGTALESTDRQPSCAVIVNGDSGVPRVSGGWPNQFDREVGFAAARDRARYAIGHVGPDEVGH
jgi:hypothetical protein